MRLVCIAAEIIGVGRRLDKVSLAFDRFPDLAEQPDLAIFHRNGSVAGQA